ncbi:MAG: MltA domain-containing protein [Leptolyngbyaceae bacterium]|nr:MltA domain-containing protein [Leptolyngbyaceae bacterium]
MKCLLVLTAMVGGAVSSVSMLSDSQPSTQGLAHSTRPGGMELELAQPGIAPPQQALLIHDLPLYPLADPDVLIHLGLDDQLFGNADQPGGDRPALLQAIDYSLDYLGTQAAVDAYADYPVPGISRDRVQRSLIRFRQLLLTRDSAAALRNAVVREFALYQAIGHDGIGTVEFTGYFTPTYTASHTPTAEYRYPLYRRPQDLDRWTEPHPTRLELEGATGLESSQGRLRGLELVWMRDRLEAFLVQVQGSARLQMTDGTTLSVGYAGRTHYPYVSLGRLLINAGKVEEEDLNLPVVLEYFAQHPDELDEYLPQNDRFVFFQLTDGGPPTGSLSQPVIRDRSIATDKTLMPPGALALIHTTLPTGPALQPQLVSRYVLDQDTGGAIRGPGRVDIFMGIGDRAGDRAGLTRSHGQLYYLLLK